MSSNFRLIYLVLFLLVSCGGSKSDVNDPILSNSGNLNNTNNTSTTTTTNTNTSSTSATQSYLIRHLSQQITGILKLFHQTMEAGGMESFNIILTKKTM